jgi:sarcosine oxidase
VEQALALGAEVRCREEVLDWEVSGGRVRVRTSRGAYEAGRLVVCAGHGSEGILTGAGSGRLAAELALGRLPFTDPGPFRPDRG